MHLLEKEAKKDNPEKIETKEDIKTVLIEDQHEVIVCPQCRITIRDRPSWLKFHIEQVHQKDADVKKVPSLDTKSEVHQSKEVINLQLAIEESKIEQNKFNAMRAQENIETKIATGNSLVEQTDKNPPDDNTIIRESLLEATRAENLQLKEELRIKASI